MTAATTVAAGAAVDAPATALYGRVSERAAFLDVSISPEELAELAVRLDMGGDELSALEAVFTYLADKRHDQVISTLLKLSRLPQRAPRPSRGSTSTAYAAGTPPRCASCRRYRTCTHGRTWRSSDQAGSGRPTLRKPTAGRVAWRASRHTTSRRPSFVIS